LYLRNQFSARARRQLMSFEGPKPDTALLRTVLQVLNHEIKRTDLYDPKRFEGITLGPATTRLIDEKPSGADLVRLNRLLLEDAFPVELTDSALALSSGEVRLVRNTVMGSAYAHRLDASESILNGMFVVDDYQHGLCDSAPGPPAASCRENMKAWKWRRTQPCLFLAFLASPATRN